MNTLVEAIKKGNLEQVTNIVKNGGFDINQTIVQY